MRPRRISLPLPSLPNTSPILEPFPYESGRNGAYNTLGVRVDGLIRFQKMYCRYA